jgi:AcrR family transcriptional regulator
MLTAIVEIVARDGFPDAKIGDIAECAGVSRATFYELFESKEACLLAAQQELASKLEEQLQLAVTQGEADRAAQSGLGALVAFADRDPVAFDFLMHETMLAGPRAIEERDRLTERLTRAIERAWEEAPCEAPVLDMSAKILLEGCVRLLGQGVRSDGEALPRLLPDLLAWIESYTVDGPPSRWRVFAPDPTSPDRPDAPAEANSRHRSAPKASHRVGAKAPKRAHRERIAYATARAIDEKGYANITVADIVAAAGLSRDVFYAHFHDKNEAFEEAIQLLFEQLLARMAGAFFGSGGSWPEQIWEAGRAFAGFLEEDPVLANLLFVGTYAPPRYIHRVDDFVLAFTVFVERGNRYRPPTAEVPRIVAEAIVCTVLEAVTFQVRHGRVRELWGLIPPITYMVYAPFMGTGEASAFVETHAAAKKA